MLVNRGVAAEVAVSVVIKMEMAVTAAVLVRVAEG